MTNSGTTHTKDATGTTKATGKPPWLIFVSVAVCLLATGPEGRAQRQPQRIISLIPAVTEMLFALGAGDRVVAVSSFDRYPPAVAKLPRVGALLDPDLERMLSLRPDLIAVYGTQTDLRRQLERAEIPLFVYSHAELADVTTTLRRLGDRLGEGQRAQALAGAIQQRLAEVRQRVASRPRPRTLIVFGRESFTLRAIHASGGYGFVHDMVAAAGGDNVFADVKRQAVQATTEQIIARRPDVILELRADPLGAAAEKKELATWRQLSSVPAVRNRRVYIVADPRAVIPGPRVAEGAEVIARVLHPDR
jgi:iron complex transport system substrate-binding protein